MITRLRPALLVATAALLAACGAAAPAAAPATPTQAVRMAATRLQGTSFRMTLTATTTSDTGGQIAAGLQQAGPVTLRAQYADATHASATVISGALHFSVVVVAGTVYVSADGVTYKTAPFLSSFLAQLSASQLHDDAGHLASNRDAGPSTQDGVATEEYRSTVDAAYVATLMQRVVSAMLGAAGSSAIPASMVAALVAALHFHQLDVTWYVDRATGHLVRATSNATLDLDLGKLFIAAGGAMPTAGAGAKTSTVTLHQVTDAHFSGWGSHITVTTPASTGTVTPQQLGAMLHAQNALS